MTGSKTGSFLRIGYSSLIPLSGLNPPLIITISISVRYNFFSHFCIIFFLLFIIFVQKLQNTYLYDFFFFKYKRGSITGKSIKILMNSLSLAKIGVTPLTDKDGFGVGISNGLWVVDQVR